MAAVAIALSLTACGDRTKRAYAEAAKAQAMLDAGDLVSARAFMDRAMQLRDDQLDLILLDGRIKYRMKQLGPAFAAYNMALAIDPMNAEALQAVSQIGAATGADAESNIASDRILEQDPNNASALMVRGVQKLNTHEYPAVLAIAEQMLKSDPLSEAGLVLKARALNLAGQKKEALALLTDGEKRIGSTQMIVTALLENARDTGEADAMAEQFRKMRGMVADNADLMLDEANFQYKRGQLAEARGRGWEVIHQHGDDATVLARLVDMWTEYDRAPLDPSELAQVAEKAPPNARLAIARFYRANGQYDTASALVGSLLGFDAVALRDRIGYEVSQSPGAAAAAETVLAQDKTNCDGLAVRASEALRRRQPGVAVIAAQQITSECPDRDGAELLARAYAAKGDDAGVRRAFLEGILARPLSSDLVARYANWLFSKGEADNAVAAARRLTQRAPAKPSAWRLYASVCARAPAQGCVAEAKAGEAAAARNFAIDLPPGERHPNPLLGNSWR